MGNFLNLVYDDWHHNAAQPNINGEKEFGANNFRRIDGLMNFYEFKNFKRFRLTEVKNYPDENFYYVIGHIHEIGHALKAHNILPLPTKVIKHLKENPNLYVIFLNEHEVETEETVIGIEKWVIDKGIDPKQIYVINNNYNLKKYKEDNNLSLNVHTIKFLPIKVAKELDMHDTDFITNKQSEFFVSHNRTPKVHRYALLVLLKKNKLLQEVDWSLVMGWNHKMDMKHTTITTFYHELFTEKEIQKMKPEIDFFEEIDIKKSRYEDNIDWFDKDWDSHVKSLPFHIEWNRVYEKQTYENSYVNITTESCFRRDNVVHLSEKTFKPLFFNQYPLYVASMNHVKTVKDVYGFDVFEDILDHSYDSESDQRKRLFKLFDEIKRVYKNKDNFISNYINLKDRFENNKKLVLELLNNKDDVDFFTSLIENKKK